MAFVPQFSYSKMEYYFVCLCVLVYSSGKRRWDSEFQTLGTPKTCYINFGSLSSLAPREEPATDHVLMNEFLQGVIHLT